MATDRTSDGRTRLVLAGIIVAAAAVRMHYLDQPMRLDEARTFMQFALGPLQETLSNYRSPNNHIFHSILVWISIRLFGHSEWAARIPAFIAGTLLVPAVFLVARELADEGAALAAAALTAGWPELILFSSNARGYALVSLAFLALLLIAVGLLEAETRGQWLLLAGVLALGIYTNPTMLYPGASVLLWMTIERTKCAGWDGLRQLMRPIVLAMAITAGLVLLGYVPVLVRQGSGAVVSNQYVTASTLPDFIGSLKRLPILLHRRLGMGLPDSVEVVIALLTSSALLWPRQNLGRRRTLAAAVIGAAVVILLLTRRVPPPRIFLYTVPIMCILAGAGLSALASSLARRVRASALTLLSYASMVLAIILGAVTIRFGSVVKSDETVSINDAREVAGYLLARAQHDERVVMYPGTETQYDYYMLRRGHRMAELQSSARHGPILLVIPTVLGEARARPEVVLQTQTDISLGNYSPAALERKFGETSVYVMPLAPGSQGSGAPRLPTTPPS